MLIASKASKPSRAKAGVSAVFVRISRFMGVYQSRPLSLRERRSEANARVARTEGAGEGPHLLRESQASPDPHPALRATFSRREKEQHSYLPIRYISGNRKIQTMSTRCQYKPARISGVGYSARILLRHTSVAIVMITHTPTSTCRLWYRVMA